MKAILVVDVEEDMIGDVDYTVLSKGNMCYGSAKLKTFPKKLKLRIQREWITDYDRYEIGYNACLDDIMGETE